MAPVARIEIVEIRDGLLPAVCRFLERAIGRGVPAAGFSATLTRRWSPGPIGFALLNDEAVVGAIGTVRAIRPVGGRAREFCNLTSFAIDPAFRSMAPSLLQRAVSPSDAVYTNFTASASVVALLRAFGFSALPPHECILLPWARRRGAAPVVAIGTDAVERAVEGRPDVARLVADHRGSAARWIGFDADGAVCVVALHLMRARGVPLAHVLYVSDASRFVACASVVARAVRQAWGFHVVAWPEWQIPRALGSVRVTRPRPVMVKGHDIAAADIDGLYTELAWLPVKA